MCRYDLCAYTYVKKWRKTFLTGKIACDFYANMYVEISEENTLNTRTCLEFISCFARLKINEVIIKINKERRRGARQDKEMEKERRESK